MDTCSNCEGPLRGEDVIHVAHRGRIVTALCTQCVSIAAKPRVTLTRDSSKDHFSYGQYVCVETLNE